MCADFVRIRNALCADFVCSHFVHGAPPSSCSTKPMRGLRLPAYCPTRERDNRPRPISRFRARAISFLLNPALNPLVTMCRAGSRRVLRVGRRDAKGAQRPEPGDAHFLGLALVDRGDDAADVRPRRLVRHEQPVAHREAYVVLRAVVALPLAQKPHVGARLVALVGLLVRKLAAGTQRIRAAFSQAADPENSDPIERAVWPAMTKKNGRSVTSPASAFMNAVTTVRSSWLAASRCAALSRNRPVMCRSLTNWRSSSSRRVVPSAP